VADEPFQVQTKGGMVECRILATKDIYADDACSREEGYEEERDEDSEKRHENLEERHIEVSMGEPRFLPGSSTLTIDGIEFRTVRVSMGNPHCVLLVQHPTEELARRIGPLIENHPDFPNRTNVQFLEVIDRKTIRIEIWERGAGYTLASGSSSCAAAAAARRLGLVDDEITVKMPGGALTIDMREPNIRMTGPAVRSFDLVFSPYLMRLAMNMKENGD
jgi:diaminopimelate epimerase